MKHIIALLVMVFIFASVNAQRGNTPSDGDVEIAKKLKVLYDDEDIVLLSKTITVEFSKSTKEGVVEAITNKNIEFLNISPSAQIQYPAFYDSESSIEAFDVFNRREKK
jgi:hypothetical protein